MMGVRIVVGDGEPIQSAIWRFRSVIDDRGILREVWRRMYARDATEVRRTKQFLRRRRAQIGERRYYESDGNHEFYFSQIGRQVPTQVSEQTIVQVSTA